MANGHAIILADAFMSRRSLWAGVNLASSAADEDRHSPIACQSDKCRSTRVSLKDLRNSPAIVAAIKRSGTASAIVQPTAIFAFEGFIGGFASPHFYMNQTACRGKEHGRHDRVHRWLPNANIAVIAWIECRKRRSTHLAVI